MKNFPITRIYNQEAEKLIAARERAQIVHSTGDIDASGDELEIPFRSMLSKRLPSKYYVGHGHIVDSNLNVSPQFDVIIADSNATPILYDGENGTQYFPYESVYAIGEIKTTYYKNRKYVENFSAAIKKVKEELFREDVPRSYIGHEINVGKGFKIEGANEIQNQLFSFMLFGALNDCVHEELNEQLKKHDISNHPQVICFLDGSVITKANVIESNGKISMGPVEMRPLEQQLDRKLAPVHLSLTNSEKSGQALVSLILGLFNHLSNTMLKEPPIDNYLNKIIKTAPYTVKIIT